MKKDLIFTPIMLVIGALLGMLKLTDMPVHIAVSVVGVLVLAVYTSVTKKEWKIPALEVVMRAFYGIALITGIVIMNVKDVVALNIVHKACAILFVVALVVLFVHKIIANKKSN